jgi:hypothetical protein
MGTGKESTQREGFFINRPYYEEDPALARELPLSLIYS